MRYIAIMLPLAVALTVTGCVTPPSTAPPPPGQQESSEASTQPAVTAYPTADNTADDLDAARDAVLSARADDNLSASELEGDLGRYQFVSTLGEWFEDHDVKPYKQVLLHRDSGQGYVYYVVYQVTPESPWSLESEFFGKEVYEPADE